MKRAHNERGAAAVEFALVAPLLLLMVLGIAEFGRAYHVQTTVSQAAREGVRVMALENNRDKAVTATKAAAPTLDPPLTDSQISVSPTNCVASGTTPAATATVEVTYPLAFTTKLFGSGVTLTGKGVMRCNG